MPKIVSIATKAASFSYKQDEILDYMLRKMAWEVDEARKVKFLYDKSGIDIRYSVLPDFQETRALADCYLYQNGHSPNVQDRMTVFTQEALPLAIDVSEKCLGGLAKKNITHLITVSCTGMSAPGLDIQLVKALGLQSTIERSSVNFMGCYAGLHALKQAHHMANSQPDACVLVVCVELCTLHFQQVADEDNTVANMLFADGATAILVASDSFESNFKNELDIKAFHSDILFSGEEDMSWNISETGFLMTLSSYVPKIIAADIRAYFLSFLEKASVSENEIDFWAIHPGGKAIVDAVAKQMELSEYQIQPSYQVLKDYGNMSSATIFFVLQEIISKHSPKEGNKIIATAFGPGLTVESVLLEF